MRTPIVAGNWKMNGSSDSIALLTEGLIEGLAASDLDAVRMIVFPPSVYLHQVWQATQASTIELGAQNVDWRAQGAVTGELEVSMLLDLGCQYCMVGHSERRQLFAESNEQVAKKFVACVAGGVLPILCVGETAEQRKSGQTMKVVSEQIMAVLDAVGTSGIAGAVIAYEPVWAIGTGDSASPEQAEEVHGVIRQLLSTQDRLVAEQTQLLYGGSVTPSNAADLFEKENIDGALVGGASLKSEDFLLICRAAAHNLED